jgi:hypothetical protein
MEASMSRQSESEAGRGAAGGGMAARFFVVFCVGFVAFLVAVPEAAARAVETERGVWLGGVNRGLILGMGLIVAAIVLAAVNADRGR